MPSNNCGKAVGQNKGPAVTFAQCNLDGEDDLQQSWAVEREKEQIAASLHCINE